MSKTVNGKTTKFYTDGTTVLAQECDGKTLYFDYGADGVAGFTVNGTEEYYYKKNVQDGNSIFRFYETLEKMCI